MEIHTVVKMPPNLYPVRTIRYSYWHTAMLSFDGTNPVEVRIIERDGKKWSYHIEIHKNEPHCVTRLDGQIKEAFLLNAIIGTE